jgi:hypothetical protein
MSRIVIVILMYRRHKPIDLCKNFTLQVRLYRWLLSLASVMKLDVHQKQTVKELTEWHFERNRKHSQPLVSIAGRSSPE